LWPGRANGAGGGYRAACPEEVILGKAVKTSAFVAVIFAHTDSLLHHQHMKKKNFCDNKFRFNALSCELRIKNYELRIVVFPFGNDLNNGRKPIP
jgi:hypothetical protein